MVYALIFEVQLPGWPPPIHYMYIFGFDLIVHEAEKEIHLGELATPQ